MKIILALALSLASALAQATVVTYSFSGEFTAPTRQVMFGDPNHAPLFNGLVQEGDRFSGQFSFDTDAVVLSGPNDNLRAVLYPLLDFQLKASGALNAAVPAWRPDHIQVTDDQPSFAGPYDELIAAGGARVDGQHTLSTSLRLFTADASAFHDFRVPVGYDSFPDASINLYLYHYDHFMYDFVSGNMQVSLLEGAAVPEPATGLLLLAGLGGFALRRRRA